MSEIEQKQCWTMKIRPHERLWHIMNMVVFGGIAKMSTPQSDCRNSVRFSFCDKASFCRIR